MWNLLKERMKVAKYSASDINYHLSANKFNSFFTNKVNAMLNSVSTNLKHCDFSYYMNCIPKHTCKFNY